MPQVNPPYPQIERLNIPIHSPYIIKEFSPPNDIRNIEQDYIDLFSYAKKGHMAKYVHMYRPHIYEDALRQEDYYPFKMECDLLIQKADQISRSLQNVTQALEIGPGSHSPVMLKTVPLLRILEHQSLLTTYKALDSNLAYAEQSCQIIQEQFPTIKTEVIEIDFLSVRKFEKIKNKLEFEGRKLLFGFGQLIFGNNNDEDISKFLNNIGMLLKEGDYLLFGTDTNKDESMLEAAYNSKMVHELLLNTMYYLKRKLNLEDFNPKEFDSVYKWNLKECTVEHSLKSTMKQTLKIRNQKFIINKNQEFNILYSRKLDIRHIKNFLNKEKLIIKEIVNLDNHQKNKFSIIIAQKNGHYC